MEAEVGFNSLIPTDARLGLGVGIGAHGWIQGASQGGSVDLFSYGRNQNPGDYRVGSSASAGLVLGPIAGKFGTSAGLYSNIVGSPETGFYWQSKGGIGVSPTFGVGAEAKLNIF
ncbi:hypothetical protein [Burkholderia cepacia]|uniref:hypothetical protein n=1 Tax=Burkholderia cepacia TaxID=292 RepID=UPI00398F520A